MSRSEADTDSTIQVTCCIIYLSFLDRENPGKHLHFYIQFNVCGLSPVTAGFSIKIKGTRHCSCFHFQTIPVTTCFFLAPLRQSSLNAHRAEGR